MSYLLCCFYSPSLCLLLSYFWVTLNIFPQVFFFFFSLFRARETRSLTEALVYSWGPIRKGPLMCMNYLKATLFWISPHFGKYFQALPHKSLAAVVSGATPPGPIYKTRVKEDTHGVPKVNNLTHCLNFSSGLLKLLFGVKCYISVGGHGLSSWNKTLHTLVVATIRVPIVRHFQTQAYVLIF